MPAAKVVIPKSTFDQLVDKCYERALEIISEEAWDYFHKTHRDQAISKICEEIFYEYISEAGYSQLVADSYHQLRVKPTGYLADKNGVLETAVRQTALIDLKTQVTRRYDAV